MTELLAAARRVFDADAYASRTTGITIEAVGDHTSRCVLHPDARHRNALGVAMGGAVFTLADLAAAVAANTACMAEGERLAWVSLDASIHYLRPAVADVLVADCHPVKQGRTTSLYQTMITDPLGKEVALVQTTMVRATH